MFGEETRGGPAFPAGQQPSPGIAFQSPDRTGYSFEEKMKVKAEAILGVGAARKPGRTGPWSEFPQGRAEGARS